MYAFSFVINLSYNFCLSMKFKNDKNEQNIKIDNIICLDINFVDE